MRNTVNETYYNLDMFIFHSIICQKTLQNYCKYEPHDKNSCETCQFHTIDSFNYGEFMSLLQILDDETNDAQYHSSIRCPRLKRVLKGMCLIQ